jgi:hypothetical protein
MTVADKPQRVIGRPFKKGQSGNPLGRHIGSRNKLDADFTAALQQDFAAHGPEAVRLVRETEPATYLKVIASVLPKQSHHTIEKLELKSDAELAAIIQQGLNGARSLPSQTAPDTKH